MIERTLEQIEDHKFVWSRMRNSFPEFTLRHDPTDNYHMVREIILGGSLSWAGVHERFKPFPGARVLDLGANVGIFSAFCAVYGARVTAYEPDPTTFGILENMVKTTGLVNVELHNKAVWNYSGDILFRGFGSETCGRLERNGELYGAGQSKEAAVYEEKIPCISLDQAIGDIEWDFVKFDIEASEYDALLGASSESLKRIKLAYVEFHPWVNSALYDRTMTKLREFFDISGDFANTGRWAYVYLTRKP